MLNGDWDGIRLEAGKSLGAFTVIQTEKDMVIIGSTGYISWGPL